MAAAACGSRNHAEGGACITVSSASVSLECPLAHFHTASSNATFYANVANLARICRACQLKWLLVAQGREKLERTRNGKIAAFLWKTLWARHKATLMASLALQGVYSAFNFAGPVILNKIVTFLQNWALWKAEQNQPLVRPPPDIVSVFDLRGLLLLSWQITV